MGPAGAAILGGAVAAGAGAGLLAGRRPPAAWAPQPSPPALVLLVAGVVCETAGGRWLAGVVVGYVLLIAFALAERRHPGMILVAVGLGANLLVMVVDRGMPVKGLASAASAGVRHHGLGAGDRLAGLADVVTGPGWVMLSPGDVVLTLGAAVTAFAWLEPRRPGRVAGR